MSLSVSERGQRLVIGAAAAANRCRAILMGTAMTVYIGRVGTPFEAGLVFAVFWLGLTLFSPVAGAIADVTGRRRAVLLGTAVISTVAILPLTVVRGVWGPLALRGLFAVFAAGFLPVMLAIVSERGGTTARGESLGFFNSAQALGFTAAQVLAGVLLGLVAPWTLYLFVAVVSAVVAVAAVFIDDPTPSADRSPSRGELLGEMRDRLFPAPENRDHLRRNGLGWLYGAALVRNTTVLGISGLLPVYLLSEVGVSELVMGLLLAINPAGQVLFMYLFGRLSDGWGRKPLIVAGMGGAGVHALVMAGAVLPGALSLRAGVAALGLFVLAAAFSAEMTGTYAFIGDVAPADRESELMGLHSTFRGFGGMTGPALIGALATVTSFETAFAAASALAFLGTLMTGFRLVESAGVVGGAAVAED